MEVPDVPYLSPKIKCALPAIQTVLKDVPMETASGASKPGVPYTTPSTYGGT